MTSVLPEKVRRKTDLIAFQNRLTERLQSGGAGSVSKARLAFELAGESWLLPLKTVSEVLPVPHLEPVPLVQPWFAGVANVRGNLYGVVDLHGYLGNSAITIDGHSRILLINRSELTGSALLVSRTVGLRHGKDLQPAEDGDVPRFARAVYRDADGRRWAELDMRRLLADPGFLSITDAD